MIREERCYGHAGAASPGGDVRVPVKREGWDGRMGISLGRYIVADPSRCHGQPTFRGSRVLVADVLEQVASGMDWDAIREEWHEAMPREAIAEAVRLGREMLLTHKDELTAAAE